MIVQIQTIPHLNALAGGSKIPGEQLSSFFRGCHTTFLVKNTLFKGEVAWQPLKELQSCSSSILLYLLGHSNEVLFVFLLSELLKIQVVVARNVHFYYIKSTFFDIITSISRTNKSRKTTNTSFECPSRWVQNTRRTDLQLFQGLSRNLSFKKCVFY